jgi:peroxiredoxin
MRVKVLLLVMLAWAGIAQADPLADFGVIQPRTRLLAPDFALTGMDGVSRSLSSYRGKIVMLHFWATWCASCRQEMPALQQLNKDFEGRDFELLCVSVDRGDGDAVRTFMHDINLHFNTLLDPEGEVRNAYAVRALPTTYLIGRDGKFSGLIMGERDWKKAGSVLDSLLVDGEDNASAQGIADRADTE